MARTFWHRARIAKIQSSKAVKSPFVLPRTQITARKRAEQSIKWAKIDDDAAAARAGKTVDAAPVPAPKVEEVVLPTQPLVPKSAPATALIGLSLLGNLDGMYKHSSYGDIKLNLLTTGSRQRAGAMLLFSYTFVGKLWLCFGYDMNGFQAGIVEEFWKEVLDGVDEFLGD